MTLRAFLRSVSPAAVGMILAAGVSIAQGSLVDLPTVLLAGLCLIALVRFKVDSALIVLSAGLIGILVL